MIKKRGRPRIYTPKLAAEICTRLASGESLRRICADKGMPDRDTVFRWMFEDTEYRESFYGQYTRARRIQAEGNAEEIIEISDESSNDIHTTEDGKEFVNREHIQRSKLRVEARQWAAERLLPKVYGPKQEVEHSGKVDGINFVFNLDSGSSKEKP